MVLFVTRRASSSQHCPKAADDDGQPAEGGDEEAPAVAAAAKVPEADGLRGARGQVAAARIARHDGVEVGEANVVAVEAVGLVHLGKAHVTGLDKGDVDALLMGKSKTLAWRVFFSLVMTIERRPGA